MAFIQGSAGNDVLDGTPLGDEILGLGGNDFIRGLNSNEIIDGGDGNDTVNGNEGNDFVQGGIGNDLTYGGQGEDVVVGGEGNDDVNGNKGNDVVLGGIGNDTVRGGQDNDTILAGEGNDVLSGDFGVDELIGGSGIDVFVLQQGKGVETILDFTLGEDFLGLDTLEGGGSLAFSNLAIVQSGNNVNISAGGQLLAILRNTQVGDLSEELFTTELTSKTTPPQIVRGNTIAGTLLDDSIGTTSSTGVTGTPGSIATAQNDTISGLVGNDTINGLGGNDQINGGDNSDFLSGSDGNDTVLGEGGNDTLQGGTGNDSLIAGGGNDVISPNSGNDTVAAGEGFDVIVLESGTTVTVTDFNSSDDFIGLSAIATASVAVEQTGGNTIIRLNPSRQVLATLVNLDSSTFDRNLNFTNNFSSPTNPPIVIPGNQISGTTGNDSIGATSSAGVFGSPSNIATDGNDTISTIQGNDTVNGLGGNDTIDGSDGNDLLNGNEGNDTLNGGFGNDSLNGSNGNDSIIGGPGNDIIDSGEGNDTITGGVDRDVFVLAPRTETLVITDFTPVDDFIALINGLSASNIQITQSGNDTVITFGGITIARLLSIPASGITAGNFTSGIVLPPNQTSPGNTITGTPGNDDIRSTATPGVVGGTATDNNDTIVGLAGNDTLGGLGGNDSIDGGDGNDIMEGSSGDDSLRGATGNDTVTGGDGNDSLLGDDGNDVLTGNLGSNTLTGGAGFDVFTLDSVVNQSITVTDFNVNQDFLGLGGGLTFESLSFAVENGNTLLRTAGRIIATLQGVTISPVPLANFTTELISKTAAPGGVVTDGNLIQGTANNDTIGSSVTTGVTGTPGNTATNFADTIFGASGNDQISGLGGGDIISGEEGTDTMVGGEGDDTLDGGSGNDRLVGEGGNDLLIGGEGNDTIEGGSGEDILLGESGNDNLTGGDGDDSIEGSSGNDSIEGGDGGDILQGGSGNDSLTGGAGIDFFVFEAAGDNGTDRLIDFISGADILDFSIEDTVRPLRGNVNPAIANVNTPGTNIGNNNIIILNTGSFRDINGLTTVPSNTVTGGNVGERVLAIYELDADGNPFSTNETIIAGASLTSDGRFTSVFAFASLPGGIGNYLGLNSSDFAFA